MGAIGGGIVHAYKGAKNSPRVTRNFSILAAGDPHPSTRPPLSRVIDFEERSRL